MQKEYLFKKSVLRWGPYSQFLPFLIIYIIIVLVVHEDAITGDENRYQMFANNLINGFYSPPAPCIDLGNGPGYPIFLIPFVILKLPLIFISLSNAILQYFSIIFIYKSLDKLVSKKLALIFSLFWAIYFNYYKFIPLAISESFTLFLVSALGYMIIITFENSNVSVKDSKVYLTGFLLGYLALTKPIFGYVLLFILLLSVPFYLLSRIKKSYLKLYFVLSIAFLTTLPYLLYTYNLTGRYFYWGSNAGNNVYWMSSPYDNEYGSWYGYHTFNFDSTSSKAAKLMDGGEEQIKAVHRQDHEIFFKFCGVEQDDEYKKVAFRNIQQHPVKYFRNLISNAGRILFNFPYSYSLQKPSTLIWLPLNGILLFLLMISAFPALKNWAMIPFSIRVLTCTALIYLGGSLFGSAEIRMFNVAVPFLLLFVSYILSKTITIRIKFEQS